MQRVFVALVLLLGGYAAGTIVVSSPLPSMTEVQSTLSPFLLISLGIFVASLGYSISSVIRVFLKRRDER